MPSGASLQPSLMQNWDIALEEINRLKEIIDSKVNKFLVSRFALDLLSIYVCLFYIFAY